MTNIVVKELTKNYGKKDNLVHALKGVSFELELGEFVVVLGPSGSGKTTLLNVLGGMDDSTSGSVEVALKDITMMNQRELVRYRREDIGFVFQFYNLMANLTAIENIEIAGGVTHKQAVEALKMVGLEHRKNNFPSQLSGGEQQRVAIARAIVKNPKLLLCDEPTGALDSKTGVHIIELLLSLKNQKDKTIVVVTHNAKLTEVADRVIRIFDGEIISNEVCHNPLSVESVQW
ncbi:MAG: ABC transporter ATP-binding protein [Candidatus Izemoplasmatales bacterium]|nr:ABC transporter ATP-binding protein [Candidatus Izemoplasmatales bacterium]